MDGLFPNKAGTNLISKLKEHLKEKERSQPTIYKVPTIYKLPTIYRVHRHLRDVNSNAYEPKVISIGPYHRGKDHLKMMEDHKLLSLQLLFERGRIDIMLLTAQLIDLASELRKCYADRDFELSESEFIEMLLLDGCFIIQLVRTYEKWDEEVDPIFRMAWMKYSLQHDLMLFENQIPFFVLCMLYKSIYPRASDLEVVRLLSNFFRRLYPVSEPSDNDVKSRSLEVAQQDSQGIMHILDLIHRNWLPRESHDAITVKMKGHESQESKGKGSESQKRLQVATLFTEARLEEAMSDSIKGKGSESQESEVKKSDTDKKGEKDSRFINCATRLTEANVKFKVNKEATCLFDIKFEHGTMVMPPLRIEDMTECVFRNLVVYEQYFKESPHDWVTQYRRLLDCLINSSKDVEILSRNHIIENWLGDDESVANMVNRLGDSIVSKTDKYTKLYEEVNEHCGKRRNRWMAKLRRDYFNSPWAIISVVAAVVLLLLTVMQTVLSLLQVV